MPFGRNAEVYGEDEPADYVYKVLSGAVRTYKVLSDGRRQILGFYLPGDVFGSDPGDEHTCSAETIVDSRILLVRRATVLKAAERDGEVARQLWALTATELKRSRTSMPCCSSRARRSGWLPSSSTWRTACRSRRRSNCRCRARTSPIIWVSRSRPYRGRSRSLRVRRSSSC